MSVNKYFITISRQLRQKQTYTEKYLWNYLRANRLSDLKFRRQHAIGDFIVDFYCAKHKLAIEIDGEIHLKDEIKCYDIERSKILALMGIKIIRFTNNEVLYETSKVLDDILNEINNLCIIKEN